MLYPFLNVMSSHLSFYLFYIGREKKLTTAPGQGQMNVINAVDTFFFSGHLRPCLSMLPASVCHTMRQI